MDGEAEAEVGTLGLEEGEEGGDLLAAGAGEEEEVGLGIGRYLERKKMMGFLWISRNVWIGNLRLNGDIQRS